MRFPSCSNFNQRSSAASLTLPLKSSRQSRRSSTTRVNNIIAVNGHVHDAIRTRLPVFCLLPNIGHGVAHFSDKVDTSYQLHPLSLSQLHYSELSCTVFEFVLGSYFHSHSPEKYEGSRRIAQNPSRHLQSHGLTLSDWIKGVDSGIHVITRVTYRHNLL